MALESASAGAQASAAASRGAVRGTVRDVGGRPLSGASVSVVGASRTAPASESGESGAFALTGLGDGELLVVVRRIGFAPETAQVLVAGGASVPLAFAMRRLALELDAVVIRGRSDLRGPMAGFYARMERGNGRFFTQEQIARRNPARMSDLMRSIPGMRIDQRRGGNQSFRLRGSTIAPLVWLDGTPMSAAEVDLDMFDPRTFAGIEIYSGAATVPVEFSGGRTMSTSGGAIVLWSRQGEARAPRRKRGDPSPAELLARLIERQEAFTADQVESTARPTSADVLRPIYPDSLYVARAGGRVEVEFVVAASGEVRMETFGVVSTTHPALGEAVRRAIAARAWTPARRGGVPVAQLVQLPFEFRPDTGVTERKPEE